jgi:hypothetical protein
MTISDPYLFVMLSWAAMFGIDVPERLSHYLARMRTEPSVAKALAGGTRCHLKAEPIAASSAMAGVRESIVRYVRQSRC